MKHNRYGYGSYRGRSAVSRFLRGVAILLAAVLVLAVLAVVFLGQYVVYSDDGARIELPFLRGEDPVPTPEAEEADPAPTLIIVTPEPTPTPVTLLHAAALPRAALADGTAKAAMEGAGANAVWFDMKADDGTLGYVSALDLAISAKASAADPALNDAIRALNDTEGLYTVARVSCFKDHLLSNADYNLNILTNSGYRWTDPQKLRWSSPTSESVRAYVTGVCRELAALGFDEILLDNAGYPTKGNLGYIKKGPLYNVDQLDDVVDAFYAQVKTALADYPDVKLSVVTTEDALDGTSGLSGQTAQTLARHADRIWIAPAQKAGANYLSLLTAAGRAFAAEDLVTLVGQPISDEYSWAVWPG